jgi:2-polyprenyl-3-methyl-5-hydroxy-6-metoxy-1,4-benzoquinol methylase
MDCLICSQAADMTIFHVDGGRYLRCPRCHGLFLDPLPEKDLNKTFASADNVANLERQDRARVAYFRQRPTRLERYRPNETRGGHLLEVGCGSGILLQEAAARGWKTDAVELSPPLAARAQANNPAAGIFAGDISDYDAAGRTYDAIICLDVLEHVLSPRDMLDRCHELLKPRGLLMLQTPNAQSLRFRLQGKAWSMLDPQQHLHLFSARALEALLMTLGFEVMEMRTVSGSGTEKGLALTLTAIRETLLDQGNLGNALCAIARRGD